jgi:hypothetical protein
LFCFVFCVDAVLRKLHHYCVELSLWLHLTVYNLERGEKKTELWGIYVKQLINMLSGSGKECGGCRVGG